MNRGAQAVFSVLLILVVFIAGCAAPLEKRPSDQSDIAVWRGRLSVRIESEQTTTQAQSFSAGFELIGTTQAGELTLYTPLGSTIAALSWAPESAIMRAQGDVRYFESLDTLIKQAIGTEIPVNALFAWLAGDNMQEAGWHADLSQLSNGRITARRIEPSPVTELRLILEK